MALTPEQQKVLDSFDALTPEAKLGLIEKILQRFGPFVTGEVKIGASAPGVIPPSGEIDPVTGAPVPPAPMPVRARAGKGG